MSNTNHTNTPSPWVSLIPIILLVGLLSCVILSFGSDAMTGASQVVLLTVSAFIVGISVMFYHIPFSYFEEAFSAKIGNVGQPIIILLLIGALGGSWMISGVVPMLIDYGISIIHPRIFLVSTCIICAIVSVMTGSSWTTIATIGVALMGIGDAQGFHAGWTAGAIISGSYFGDKISPLSDTTVLAASTTGTPLMKHIRYMMVTTTPTFTITLCIFLAAGLMHTATSGQEMAAFTNGLESTFNISPWLLMVPLITAVMIAMHWPSLVVLFVSTLTGTLAAILWQPDLIQALAGPDAASPMFKGTMQMLFGNTAIDTGHEALNNLISTRGMSGMLNTIWLIICAMVFGGAMTASGMLESIMRMFLHFTHKTVSLVGSTVGVGLMLNTVCADQYLSIILTGNMFQNTYKNKGYESRLLSRTVEDSVTVTSVLIPWNTCGMTQSMVLGVSTFTYLPFCFFNYLSPLMTLFMAAIGYKIVRTPLTQPSKEDELNQTSYLQHDAD